MTQITREQRSKPVPKPNRKGSAKRNDGANPRNSGMRTPRYRMMPGPTTSPRSMTTLKSSFDAFLTEGYYKMHGSATLGWKFLTQDVCPRLSDKSLGYASFATGLGTSIRNAMNLLFMHGDHVWDKWNDTQYGYYVTMTLLAAQLIQLMRVKNRLAKLIPMALRSDDGFRHDLDADFFHETAFTETVMNDLTIQIVGPNGMGPVPELAFFLADWFSVWFQLQPARFTGFVDALYLQPYGSIRWTDGEVQTAIRTYRSLVEGFVTEAQMPLNSRPIEAQDLASPAPVSLDSQFGFAYEFFMPVAHRNGGDTGYAIAGELYGSGTPLVWDAWLDLPSWQPMMCLLRSSGTGAITSLLAQAGVADPAALGANNPYALMWKRSDTIPTIINVASLSLGGNDGGEIFCMFMNFANKAALTWNMPYSMIYVPPVLGSTAEYDTRFESYIAMVMATKSFFYANKVFRPIGPDLRVLLQNFGGAIKPLGPVANTPTGTTGSPNTSGTTVSFLQQPGKKGNPSTHSKLPPQKMANYERMPPNLLDPHQIEFNARDDARNTLAAVRQLEFNARQNSRDAIDDARQAAFDARELARNTTGASNTEIIGSALYTPW